MKPTPQIKLASQYLTNVGGSIEVGKFDEDHEPIGEILRFQLCDLGLARQESGVIFSMPAKSAHELGAVKIPRVRAYPKPKAFTLRQVLKVG